MLTKYGTKEWIVMCKTVKGKNILMMACLFAVFVFMPPYTAESNDETLCSIKIPEKTIVYGDKYSVGITMNPKGYERQLGIFINPSFGSEKDDIEMVGEGVLHANESTIDILIDTTKVSRDMVVDMSCGPVLDLLPDEIGGEGVEDNVKPCDVVPLTITYKGKLLNVSEVDWSQCSDEIGTHEKMSNDNYTENFIAGYPEKRESDNECICVEYSDPESGKTYKDCSTALVAATQINREPQTCPYTQSCEVVPDDPDTPPNGSNLPEYMTSVDEKPKRVKRDTEEPEKYVNYDIDGDCKPNPESACTAPISMNMTFSIDDETGDVTFKTNLDNSNYYTHQTNWAMYEVSYSNDFHKEDANTGFIDVTNFEWKNNDSITVKDIDLITGAIYRIVARTYLFKKEACGGDYVTILTDYIDFPPPVKLMAVMSNRNKCAFAMLDPNRPFYNKDTGAKEGEGVYINPFYKKNRKGTRYTQALDSSITEVYNSGLRHNFIYTYYKPGDTFNLFLEFEDPKANEKFRNIFKWKAEVPFQSSESQEHKFPEYDASTPPTDFASVSSDVYSPGDVNPPERNSILGVPLPSEIFITFPGLPVKYDPGFTARIGLVTDDFCNDSYGALTRFVGFFSVLARFKMTPTLFNIFFDKELNEEYKYTSSSNADIHCDSGTIDYPAGVDFTSFPLVSSVQDPVYDTTFYLHGDGDVPQIYNGVGRINEYVWNKDSILSKEVLDSNFIEYYINWDLTWSDGENSIPSPAQSFLPQIKSALMNLESSTNGGWTEFIYPENGYLTIPEEPSIRIRAEEGMYHDMDVGIPLNNAQFDSGVEVRYHFVRDTTYSQSAVPIASVKTIEVKTTLKDTFDFDPFTNHRWAK